MVRISKQYSKHKDRQQLTDDDVRSAGLVALLTAERLERGLISDVDAAIDLVVGTPDIRSNCRIDDEGQG